MPCIICQKCNKLVLDSNAKDTSICLKCYDKEHLTIDEVIEEKYKLKKIIDEQMKLIEQTLETNASLRYLEEENINLNRQIGLDKIELLKTVDNHSLDKEFERRGKEEYSSSKEREFLLNGSSLALYDEVIRRCENRATDKFKHDLSNAMDL